MERDPDMPPCCSQCGMPYYIDASGVASHVDPEAPDGIDHEADADHVPYGGLEEDWDEELMEGTEEAIEDADNRFLDHSVNCYFCGGLFHESDCQPADEWNNGDGGSICPECLKGRQLQVRTTGHQAVEN
jgi:hypothetical protein